MNPIYVSGLGVVSPAGWGMPAFREALTLGQPLSTQPLARPGWERPLTIRPVPPPSLRPAFFSHPRLRRASPITHSAGFAVLEALKTAGITPAESTRKLAIIMCLQSGCVQYSQRFFEEAIRDPATASPLIFPETVFGGPASHIAALFSNHPFTCTLVGDPAAFLQGIVLAADWLLDRQFDDCVVVGAEETNWLLADALWHLDRGAILSGGAGAVCLTTDPERSQGVELALVTEAYRYGHTRSRALAARQMRQELPPGAIAELLCDGRQNRRHADAAENAAWVDWPGSRLSPKALLGEGLMAASAWQCAAACDLIIQKRYPVAQLSLVGCNQQAIGARWVAGPA